MPNEIITSAQMRAIDSAAAAAGTPTRELMERAGRAVAEAVLARYSPRPVAVLCGPGMNGGDGFVAARLLHAAGWPVWVETLAPIDALKRDSADAASAWDGETFPLGANSKIPDLSIDALFGAGLSRPLEGEAAKAARKLALDPGRVVAVDVPSGIDADTGKPIGDAYVRAGLTVTFGRKKPAHVLASRALCGEIVLADIGIANEIVSAQRINTFENTPSLWLSAFPRPDLEAHKHKRGHAMIASGGFARTGAARLSARGALRIGAGLVTILSPRDAMAENAAQLTAIMLRETEGNGAFSDAAERAQALIIGPAFGTDRRQQLDAALRVKNRCPLVLDADALTMLAPLSDKTVSAHDVLTPHIGEFNRLFPDLIEQTPSKLEAARAAAARCGAIVLLKGPDTIIAAPDGRAVINTTGSAYLATAGSGDVLAGMIAGLIAQGMNSFHAAAAAAYLHGRAGEMLGAGLIAEDIPEILPTLLKGLAL